MNRVRQCLFAGAVLALGACGDDKGPAGITGTLQTGALTFSGKLPAGTAETVSARAASLTRVNVAGDGTFALDLAGGTRYVLTAESGGSVIATFTFLANRNGTRTTYLQVAGHNAPATALEAAESHDLGTVTVTDHEARPEHEPLETLDSDDDGTPDLDDTDDDADGVGDDDDELFGNESHEDHAAVDEDGDGTLNWDDSDIDGDGVENGHDDTPGDDAEENHEHPAADPSDIDHDGKKNVDEFGAHDGFSGERSLENHEALFDTDIDGDGFNNDSGDETDIDGDGTPDGDDTDIDGDGIANQCDADMDGDGKFNNQPAQASFCSGLEAAFPGHYEAAYNTYCTQGSLDTDPDGDGQLDDASFPGAGTGGCD